MSIGISDNGGRDGGTGDGREGVVAADLFDVLPFDELERLSLDAARRIMQLVQDIDYIIGSTPEEFQDNVLEPRLMKMLTRADEDAWALTRHYSQLLHTSTVRPHRLA